MREQPREPATFFAVAAFARHERADDFAFVRKLAAAERSAVFVERGERFGEATTRSWNRMVGAWATFQDELANLPALLPRGPTREVTPRTVLPPSPGLVKK